MAYPPATLPSNRVDATPQATNHPNDHNAIAHAIADIVSELGNNPSGPSGTLQQRVTANENTLNNKVNLSGDTMTGVLHLAMPESYDAVSDNAAMPRSWVVDKMVNKSGDTMTGVLSVGGDPASTPAVKLFADGGVTQAVNTAGSASMSLRRGIAADAVGQVFIRFERGASPGTLISDIEVGASQDRVLFTNLVVGTPCDYRLKEPAGPITDAAGRVADLARRAFRGRWKSGGDELDMLAAHDIAEVAPYAVIGDKDGPATQQVDFAGLVPLLVSALGNVLDRITVLEAR